MSGSPRKAQPPAGDVPARKGSFFQGQWLGVLVVIIASWFAVPKSGGLEFLGYREVQA